MDQKDGGVIERMYGGVREIGSGKWGVGRFEIRGDRVELKR